MKPAYKVSLAIAVLLLAGYLALSYSPGPNPRRLAERALSAADKSERVAAVLELVMLKDPDPTPQLRMVLEKSNDSGILIQVLSGLTNRLDNESLPGFFVALGSSDADVRSAALAGLYRFYGGGLPDNIEYRADAPVQERDAAIRRLKEFYDETKSPGTSINGVALTAAAKAAEPAVKEPATPSPAAATSSPSPPSTPAPSAPPIPWTGAEPAQENPAINLLAWMCRILAVIVLLADLGGAIALALGGGRSTGHAKSVAASLKAQASVVDEMERIVARNSSGMWAKVAILVAGAMSVVALLTVAELIQMVSIVQQTAIHVEQTAVRMEQKMDYLSRK